MSVDSGFDALQQEADVLKDVVDTARRRRDTFTRTLPRADDVAKVRASGSLKRGTHNDPLHDVDLIVVYDEDDHPDWGQPGQSAEDALRRSASVVTDLLGPDAGQTEQVRLARLQNHSVKCFLDDPDDPGAFTVDLTPALLRTNGGFWIPQRDDRIWVPTNPQILEDSVAARHAAWRQFAKLVRVLKRWNADHGGLMKSLTVEILALNHLPVADRPEALARFFTAASAAVWQPILDPAGLCGEIQPNLDRVAAHAALSTAADRAWQAVNDDSRGEDRAAMCGWREVFGPIYPEAEGGCGKSAGMGAAAFAAPAFIPSNRRKVAYVEQG
jgi:hypothetical protein